MSGLPLARRARGLAAARPRTGVLANADALALAGLALLFIALTALTWRRWGVPAIDAGADLTTADIVSKGAVAYQDVRYYYGPAGLYALAGAFKLFGVSFTTAYAFGLVQTAAILGAFYALARQLLTVTTAFLATALLAAIGFSGTAFNFVLPHTNSATFGTLFTLLMLLALVRERCVLAGLAAGMLGLTRPEFAAVAALCAAAYLIGLARDQGIGVALRTLPKLALPALLLAGGVLAIFSAQAGAAVVFTENLWPVDLLRVVNFGSQQTWAPFDLASVVSTLARAAIYCGLLAGLVASAVRFSRSRGLGRVTALWPLAAAAVALGLGAALWRLSGLFPAARAAVQEECTHLLLGMSWLPALGFLAVAIVGVRFLRGGAPLITSSWAVDLALVVAAAALGARAYDAFTAEVSYAPYYAAPLVLLLGLLHERIGERWPAARTAALAALGGVAAALAAYALVALYPDHDTPVHTARGTFMTDAAAAPAFQSAVDFIERRTAAGERILALPADAGLYFMTGRTPALYDVQVLPGQLDSRADERAAIATLRRDRVRYAVQGSHEFVGYGLPHFGKDYNQLLAAHLRASGPPAATFGDPTIEAAGTNPARGFTVFRLQP